jgi:iron complex outermembrane receptor protein
MDTSTWKWLESTRRHLATARYGVLAGSTFAVALLASSTPALGAETQVSATAGNVLEEVVVTARYREEKLQETPIAITAITALDLEQRDMTTASDIAYTVPNASFRPAQAAYGNTMTAYIRGIGQYDFNFAFEPGVGIYVDDVYYPTVMSSQFDLLDLERVEVLRGPQGTLFGRGSIGGAIRYVSRKPTGDNSGFVEGSFGDFHRVDLRGSYDFALVPDKVFARISGVSKQQKGYQNIIDFACAFPAQAGTLPASTRNRNQGCKVGTLGGTDVSGARIQLRLVSSDTLEFGLAADYQQDDSESRADSMTGIVPLATACPPAPAVCSGSTLWNVAMINTYGVPYDTRFLSSDRRVTYATFSDPYTGLAFPPQTALTQQGVSGTADWKLSDNVNAKVILAWRKWNGQFSTDQDGSPLGYGTVNGLQDFQYRTGELQVTGTAMQRFDWTVGAFFYNANSTSAQSVGLPVFMGPRLAAYLTDPTGVNASGLPNSLLVNGLDKGHYENSSGFVHGVFHLTDSFRLNLGARYSDDKKHDDFDNTIFATPIDSNATRFDWLAGLDFQLSEGVLTYLTASTGYRPPAYNPRPFQQTQFVAVDGENMTSYELGLKSDLFDRKMRLNVAAFYSDYKQRIVPAGGIECLKFPDGTCILGPTGAPVAFIPLTNYVNSPGTIKGGELELEFRPVGALLFEGSVGYTNFSASVAATGGITANDQPIFVPEWNASAALQYTFNLAGGGTIIPRYDAYMQTEICSQVTTLTSCAGGYTLHNARVEFATTDRTWTVALGVSNLTDKEYLLNIFDLTAFGEATIEGQPGAPREYYVSMRRNFK